MRELEFSQQKMTAKREETYSLFPQLHQTLPHKAFNIFSIYMLYPVTRLLNILQVPTDCLKNSFSSFKMYLLKGLGNTWGGFPVASYSHPSEQVAFSYM